MGRAELFPKNRWLTVQMAAIIVLTPLAVLGVLVGGVIVLPTFTTVGAVVLAAISSASAVRKHRAAPRPRIVTEAQEPELIGIVDRLCLVADIRRPDVVVEAWKRPNSWIVQLPGRTPRLHVTSGLIALLDEDELAAVIAHELSHVANGDATVMTLVGLPSILLQRAGGNAILGGAYIVSSLGANALSRRRELIADRGAARITGRPSALAAALLKVSEDLAAGPRSDLRKVALADSFHLLPMKRPRFRIPVLGRLDETHPPLARRLEALEQLEHHLQHARSPL